MSDPTVRALRLLSLLQTHQFWSGPELAERLSVSQRTLRRDFDRLRELGYRISAAPGVTGGYRLEASSALPPLLVDEDEAVAIAVGLRTAALHGLTDGEQTSLRALAKLEQVLPRNLRRRVNALQTHTMPAAWGEQPRVAADVLAQLALACRDQERVRFRYTARTGEESSRLVEPHSLVPQGHRWYLIAWDITRDDWRLFRIDRLEDLRRTGVRAQPRQLPTEDAAQFLNSALSATSDRYEMLLRLYMDRDRFEARFRHWGRGAFESQKGVMDWNIQGSTPEELLAYLFWLPEDVEWELHSDDPEVRSAAMRFRDRLDRAFQD
ncbi:helix-turn-helix transcriptional regulator [Nesterenkonia haasae]|uniref:helix-turn-helix transcriptional regulator n=1 Tax=Nesterenkonia haasae TaxID=2587813 RepID=UPI001390C926|nr:WYL domain-containing protein [Nesterenkonia haasae]NDK32190.1 WYL domain-containing protein [Nesterenkonia haasae]